MENPAETLRRLSELWNLDPLTLIRRANANGLDIPEELAGLPLSQVYARGTRYYKHTGTIREICESAGVSVNTFYDIKKRNPELRIDQIISFMLGEE